MKTKCGLDVDVPMLAQGLYNNFCEGDKAVLAAGMVPLLWINCLKRVLADDIAERFDRFGVRSLYPAVVEEYVEEVSKAVVIELYKVGPKFV